MNLRTIGLIIAASLLVTFPAAAQDDIPEVQAEVGQPAPDFTLTDHDGTEHTLSSYQGQYVVLEWTNPQCPYVVRHYQAETMKGLAQEHDHVVWLAVNSSHFNTPDDSRQWIEEHGLAYPTLQDPEGTVGHTYGARTTPQMFVIDPQGVIRYAGAIDSDPRGMEDAPTNYVDQALAALMAGEEPPVTQTEPYGCSVKYEGVN